MMNKRELLKKTKCQLEGGLRDGSDSQALSSFNYHFITDILSVFLFQHSVISWNGVIHSHIERLDDVLHHNSDLRIHFYFAILDDRASLLVDCLYIGHFTYRILLGEVQTLRLESSHFCFCHLCFKKLKLLLSLRELSKHLHALQSAL